MIYSATDQSDSRTRAGRQQNGDTYTLEISFPAVKYVLDLPIFHLYKEMHNILSHNS